MDLDNIARATGAVDLSRIGPRTEGAVDLSYAEKRTPVRQYADPRVQARVERQHRARRNAVGRRKAS